MWCEWGRSEIQGLCIAPRVLKQQHEQQGTVVVDVVVMVVVWLLPFASIEVSDTREATAGGRWSACESFSSPLILLLPFEVLSNALRISISNPVPTRVTMVSSCNEAARTLWSEEEEEEESEAEGEEEGEARWARSLCLRMELSGNPTGRQCFNRCDVAASSEGDEGIMREINPAPGYTDIPA